MKKLILTLAMVMMVLAASANSVRYFTRSQANRVARTLDAQNELMIYCGYEYELATYVIVNEVWAERVNSKYYEIWLYGYDAYTGEEIYMPVDLACIWLYNSYGNRMYSAAQYLRFRSTVATPNFYWTMPPYNPFVRHFHDPHFNHCYTYHYEIHRYGWRPPMPPPHGGPWAYHPYYMRTPHTPAPVPSRPFTPGVTYPMTPDGHGYVGGNRGATGNRSTAFNNVGGARSGNSMNNAGNPGTTSRNTSANSGTVNGRGNATGGSNSRGNAVNSGNTGGRDNTVNSGSSNGRGTTANSGTSNGRGNATNSGSSNSRGSATTTSSNNRGSATTSSNSRGGTTTNTNTRGTSGNTRGSSTTTTNDSKSTTNNSRGTTTSGRSNNRGTSATTTSSDSRNTSSRNDNTNRGSSRTR